jgi:hypothetical protein
MKRENILIKLDERRRVSFGKLGLHSKYLVHEKPDGVIVFKPIYDDSSEEFGPWQTNKETGSQRL